MSAKSLHWTDILKINAANPGRTDRLIKLRRRYNGHADIYGEGVFNGKPHQATNFDERHTFAMVDGEPVFSENTVIDGRTLNTVNGPRYV